MKSRQTLRWVGALSIAWVLLGIRASAADGAGSTSADFLKIGMGARAAGMGNAFAPVADDSTAVYWNPAGMMLTRGTGFSMTHAEWLDGVNHEFLSFSHRLDKEGAFGLSLTYLGVKPFRGALETSSGDYGGLGDTVTAHDFALTAAYAQRVGYWKPRKFLNKLLVGFKVTFVGENNNGSGAAGAAFDFGTMYEIRKRRTYLSLVLSNLGTSVKGVSLPMVGTFGASHQLRHLLMKTDRLTLAVDSNLYVDTGAKVNAGTEYVMRFGTQDVSLRGGYSSGYNLDGTAGLSVGAGILKRLDGFDMSLDYALAPYGVLGLTHRVTLNFRTGGPPAGPIPELDSRESFTVGEEKLALKPHWSAEEEIARWRITVSDMQNKNVKVYSGKGEPPSLLLWDGLKDDNTEVPEGVYRVDFRLDDSEDQSGWAAPRVIQVRHIKIPPKTTYQYGFQFSGDMLFDSAKSDLQPRAFDSIGRAAKVLQARYPESKIVVAGYTDNVRLLPTSSFKSNQELSVARAQAVLDYLVKIGMDPQKLSVVGYGDTKPLVPNTTAENKAKNRRVGLMVYGEKTLNVDGLLEEAATLMRDGLLNNALAQLDKAVTLEPGEARVHKLRGNCLWKLGRKPEALESYRKTLFLDPSDQELARWLEQQNAVQAPSPAGTTQEVPVVQAPETPGPVPAAK